MRSPSRSSHSPISSMLRSGERFSTTPGATTSLEEKITPPTMRSFGMAARNAPPGSRKERSGVAGWSLRQADVVPPGNAVLGEHDGGVVTEQRFQPVGERGDAGRLQGADDDILRAEIGRVVGGLHAGLELIAAHAQRQAVVPHGRQMRPAHHAGNLVAGARQPHRQMAADGARAENTDAHENVPFTDGAPVSTSLRASATRVMRLARPASAERDGSAAACPGHSAAQKQPREDRRCRPTQSCGLSMTAGSPPSRSTARRSTMPMTAR